MEKKERLTKRIYITSSVYDRIVALCRNRQLPCGVIEDLLDEHDLRVSNENLHGKTTGILNPSK